MLETIAPWMSQCKLQLPHPCLYRKRHSTRGCPLNTTALATRRSPRKPPQQWHHRNALYRSQAWPVHPVCLTLRESCRKKPVRDTPMLHWEAGCGLSDPAVSTIGWACALPSGSPLTAFVKSPDALVASSLCNSTDVCLMFVGSWHLSFKKPLVWGEMCLWVS